MSTLALYAISAFRILDLQGTMRCTLHLVAAVSSADAELVFKRCMRNSFDKPYDVAYVTTDESIQAAYRANSDHARHMQLPGTATQDISCEHYNAWVRAMTRPFTCDLPASPPQYRRID